MFKDPNFYLTLLGVALAVASIYLALRKRRPGELTYVEEGAVSLLSDVAASMEDLKIEYSGQPITSNLALLKAHIVNTGAKDITADLVATPLGLSLPDSMKWIQAKVSKCSPGVNASCVIKDNGLIFDLGMLRLGEFISFEAVLEVPQGCKLNSIRRGISFSHRIADVGNIKAELLPPKESRRLKWLLTREAIVQSIIFAVMLSLINVISGYVFGRAHELVYRFSQNSAPVEARIKVVSKPDLIEVKPVSGADAWEESGSEFFARPDLKIESREKPKTAWSYLFPISMVLIYGLLSIGDVRSFLRAKRLYRTLDGDT